MRFLFLLAASSAAAFGLGFAKFFGYRHLVSAVHTEADAAWVIQAVGALMTFGPVAAYAVAAPLAAAFPKRAVMAGAGGALGVLLLAGHATDWAGTPWLYLFAVGVLMGIFSAGKMACAPLEAAASGRSVFAVNAALSVAFVAAMLGGVVAGTCAYERFPRNGVFVLICAFLAAAAAGAACAYPGERLAPAWRAFRGTLSDTACLGAKYPLYLLSSPLLWGVAAATSLAATAYAESRGLAGPEMCSAMALFPTVGAVAGMAASPWFEATRHRTAAVSAFVLAVLVLSSPAVVEGGAALGLAPSVCYWALAAVLLLAGGAFGLCSNLVDSEFLALVGKERKEGPGAALQSALTAFFSFVCGGLVALAILSQLVCPVSQFALLALLAGAGAALILLLAALEGSLDGLLAGLLVFAGRPLLRLRYTITVVGLESLPRPAKSLLILPNHPAEMDPVLLESILWPVCRPRPVVIDSFFYMPVVGKILKLFRAICMPDITAGAGQYKRLRIARALDAAAAALRAGDSVLIYPSGMLTRTGHEAIGAKSGVRSLLSAAPEARPVLVRTEGMWGSSFSTALHGGRTPDILVVFRNAARTLLRNAFFFCPRRPVRITLFAPADFPRDAAAPEMNRWLENFYNSGLGKEPLLVSYSLLRRSIPDFGAAAAAAAGEASKADAPPIPPAIMDATRRKLAEALGRGDPGSIPAEARLTEDLGLDSLARAEALSWVDEHYGRIPADMDVDALRTVADIARAAAAAAAAAADGVPTAPAGGGGGGGASRAAAPDAWLGGPSLPVLPPEGGTLPEAFLRCCDRLPPGYPAIADEASGMLDRRRMKTAVIALARAFQTFEGGRLGVMLPASCAADLCCMAALLAGKTPVMLNWTTGRRNLEHAARVTGLSRVVTSGRFMDKLPNADFGEVEGLLTTLEDIRKDMIGLGEKLAAWGESLKDADSLMDAFGLERLSPSDTGVILFTSGSESAPKGVPLTHANILENLRSSMEVISFRPDDVLCGFLPPFHSFGFTACAMAPMVGGLRVAHHPDPTDSKRVADLCGKWGVTVMLGTPTFLIGALKALHGRPHRLRLLITGAEKAPASLFDLAAANGGIHVVEGYGVTECAPIVTINRPGRPSGGVGQPAPGVSLLIVHPETHAPLPQGERGLVLVRGPNVFPGYIGTDKDPFLAVDGQRWYNTGDLGRLDAEGRLVLEGRLARFVKIGGEMISLPALEAALEGALPAAAAGGRLAVCAAEPAEGRPALVLFADFDVDAETANAALRSAGFSNIARIARAVRVDQMPLLGTGKTDYRSLAARLARADA